ncbi:AraC family transcriptional regulator [Paenibacillus sp. MBLB4367]|uniref:AraC family transcriptional regulator n=1 Tax=Paenibacillus sp. MBLB4367 TaxID=3384767 RepID=UPI0039080B88
MSRFKEIVLPECGINLYESKHKEGDIVNEHFHDVYQILYSLEGEGTVTLEQQQYRFEPDHALIIPPSAKHSVKSSSRLTLLVLAFDASIFKADSLGSLLQASFSASAYRKLNSFTANELRQLLRKMLFEQSKQDSLYPLAIRIALIEILLVIARSMQSQAADSNSLRADRIRAYINSHYFEKLSADVIGLRMGISARYVNTIFKEQYGITPTQYLSDVRIELAKSMLAETDKAIVSIAFEVGYETLPTFYRNFKQAVHMSPHQYRQYHTQAAPLE